ncbi:HdeD family acid-resistance protein [Jejuia pallidilutea]|nr:DUF308 domain-containing protein [Jejuia pallidilutea]GAL67836.1 hypothetical protein JCM19301_1620 [Jejuia pallidilutea]GAL72971.1 hypothetical protein JCM19302_4265 [Jejuia pallidilutea]
MENLFLKKVKESVKHWYLVLIVGILLISTGIWTFTHPKESYVALGFIFSISFLCTGILELLFAFLNRNEIENWIWILILGALNTLVGFMLISNTAISILGLSLYVGFVIMFRSLWAVATSIDLKNYGVKGWVNLMLVGVLGVVFSFILIRNPALAGMTLVFWTGIAFLLSGIFNTYLAFKMKNLHNKWDSISFKNE